MAVKNYICERFSIQVRLDSSQGLDVLNLANMLSSSYLSLANMLNSSYLLAWLSDPKVLRPAITRSPTASEFGKYVRLMCLGLAT